MTEYTEGWLHLIASQAWCPGERHPPLHSFYGLSTTHINGLLLESHCQIKLPFVSLSAKWVVYGNFTQISGIISRNSKKPWSCWEEYHTFWRKSLIMMLQINCLVHWMLKRYHCNFFQFIYFSWRLITLKYCSGFCHTLTWISHGCTCVPHPESPAHLPPHPESRAHLPPHPTVNYSANSLVLG